MAKEVAKAYVQIMPSAKGIAGAISSVLGNEADSAGAKVGSTIIAGITGAITAAGLGKLISSSLSEGANLQQSLGGIETLFKGSADKVKAYADQAYRTSGLSANAYMENVTGFSASLLQSLGGDTDKAADIANMAMVDMSDNANKMGTSMESIQLAYQGFAKQNYTMLDNLKLGYGGTKSEMERLLADAEKLTGVKYDISNLSDVYEAIHAIQENLDITGTTAKEASTTFSGSLASMKAAAQDVLGNLSLGRDIQPSLQALVETTATFLFDNFIPMVGNILKGLPGAVGTLLKEGITRLVSEVFGEGMANDVRKELTKVEEVFKTVFDMIFGSLSNKDNVDLLKSLGIDEGLAQNIVNFGENIRLTFDNIGGIIGNVCKIIGDFIGDLLGIAGSEESVSGVGNAFEQLSEFLKDVTEKLKAFTGWLSENQPALDVFKGLVVSIGTAFAAWKITSILTSLGGFSGILATVGSAVTAFAGTVTAAIGSIPIIGWIAAAVAGLVWFFTQTETGKELWSKFIDWAKGAWEGIKQFFSDLWQGISEGANNLWTGVTETWNTVVEMVKGLWEELVTFFTGLWENIKSTATTAWTLLVEGITAVVQPFIDTFMQYWTAMSEGLSTMWEGIKIIFQGAWEFIKSIFMGAVLIILDLVTGNFGQLKADLDLIWESIKSAVSLVWEGIKTYFSGVVDTIVAFATTAFENFKNNLSLIWEFIKTAASTAWEWLKTTVSNLITGLVDGAKATWEGFKSFLSGLWETIKSTAIGAWENLKSSVQNTIDNLVAGAQRAWDNLKQGVSDLVSRVTSIFDGLRSIDLWSAGSAIINGFLNGLKSAYENVKSFVGGIADWIRQNKGPISYDRKLLVPAGKVIMGGFNKSLISGFEEVKDTVRGMAPALAGAIGTAELDMGLTTSGAALSGQDLVMSHQLAAESSTAQLVNRLEVGLGRLEALLGALVDKDTSVYLDGEAIAQNSYRHQAKIMLREGF